MESTAADYRTLAIAHRQEVVRNAARDNALRASRAKARKPVTKTKATKVTQRPSRNLKRTGPALEKRAKNSSRLDLRHADLWDRIARCETGGRWSYNGSSGYDGGLQFLPSTWREWGGTDFAPHAWQATREEQITVANRSGRTNPWLTPWPVCGRKAAAALGYAFP